MAFSWEQTKKDAVEKKIKNAIILSGLNKKEATGNPSYRAIHNYKSVEEIKVKIRDIVLKQQEQHDLRMAKIHGKN